MIGLLIFLAIGSGASEPPDNASTQPKLGANHWAFRLIERPPVPETADPAWSHNPIDRFVRTKLDAAGLSPMPPASRRTLIRRVTFGLTGLPPAADEVDAFVRDTSPDALNRLLDRLLASPAYGERWAQHWLDIARFAETDGFEHDLVRPNAWRYRDWVIEALNADMPYDEFVRLQIAGDELALAHSRASGDSRGPFRDSIATGFLLCGPDMPDINLQDERRHNVLNEMTGAIGSVFLGLQIGCAQCHDHKFDPISQADFYRLRSFFEPADFFDEAPLASPAELAERERIEAPIRAERQRIVKELKRFDTIAHERLNKDPQVKISRDELLQALSETERDEFRSLLDAERDLASENKLEPLPMGRVLREKGGVPRASHVMLRGDFRQPGPRVKPAFPAAANPAHEPVEIAQEVAPSSGRRTALAKWLTRPDNILTGRVIVNRVWQFHFGEGLVRTPSDFGTMGEKPSHPELLDWLAAEFARPISEFDSLGRPGLGWSLKRLHKLLLTSATYRQASRPTEPDWTDAERDLARTSWQQSRLIDPENRLLGRMNRLRLDGESIRDTMLISSDRLSPRRGGPGVRPPLPQELVATLLKGQWVVSPDEEDHRRRSIYIFVRRNLRYPIFDVFDRPDTNASCPQRHLSTTAPQSLTLLNSEFAFTSARALAELVRNEPDPADRIILAYQRTLAREPSREEVALATRFIAEQTQRLERREAGQVEDTQHANSPSAELAAWTELCLALFNTSEFIYLD